MARSARDEVTESGAFDPSPSAFLSFVAYSCPWACRCLCLAYIKLKGLDHAIGFTAVKPIFERTKETDDHMGWVFPATADEEPDPLNGAKSIRDLYEIASKNYAGKPSVPALDKREDILSKQRFLCGNQLTEADVRLFTTLIRFDEINNSRVWYYNFKLHLFLFSWFTLSTSNATRSSSGNTQNLFNYTKDIYQIPGISSTVNMDHIRKSYYGGYSPINPYGIIPVGPNIDYNAPHDREKFNA